MSRIQDILKKAERDGTVHRTRALTNPEPVEWPRPDSGGDGRIPPPRRSPNLRAWRCHRSR